MIQIAGMFAAKSLYDLLCMLDLPAAQIGLPSWVKDLSPSFSAFAVNLSSNIGHTRFTTANRCELVQFRLCSVALNVWLAAICLRIWVQAGDSICDAVNFC